MSWRNLVDQLPVEFDPGLADDLRHEFNLPDRAAWPAEIRPIRFWSYFVQ
jgi:hypothetical protein